MTWRVCVVDGLRKVKSCEIKLYIYQIFIYLRTVRLYNHVFGWNISRLFELILKLVYAQGKQSRQTVRFTIESFDKFGLCQWHSVIHQAFMV